MVKACHGNDNLWVWRAVAWLIYAAVVASIAAAAILPKLSSLLSNLYQNCSGPYATFFAIALLASFFVSSVARYVYAGFLFRLQNIITAYFACPAFLTFSATLLLLLLSDSDDDDDDEDDTTTNNNNNNSPAQQRYLPFLLLSLSFAFRFSSSRPLSDLTPLRRWFARASEYLAFIRLWRTSWTPLHHLCFFTIVSIVRSHELLRRWQRYHAKRVFDTHQARRRFRTLDRILVPRLIAASWPLADTGSTVNSTTLDSPTTRFPPESESESDSATPPPSSPCSCQSISTSLPESIHVTWPTQQWSDHREWMQGHLLSTGLYQHLLNKPEYFTFFWTQGSGLLVLSGITILLPTAVDMSRQLISPEAIASNNTANTSSRLGNATHPRRDPIAWIISVYCGISFLYVLVQSFPALVARIVEADEDTKARVSLARIERPGPAVEGSPSSVNSRQDPSEDDQGYTDVVLRGHLPDLLKQLFTGTALDDIAELRDAPIGHLCWFATPTVIRALECYECIPYVLSFAVLQLTVRRFFVASVAACVQSMRLIVNGTVSAFRVGVTGHRKRMILENVVQIAIMLSATDIWRTKTAIVEAEMGLYHIYAKFSDGESRVVEAFRSLQIKGINDDRHLDDRRCSEGGESMMCSSIGLFDLAFSHVDRILQMLSPARNSDKRERSSATHFELDLVQNMDHFRSFRNLLLLLRMYYIEPYRANLLLMNADDTGGGESDQAFGDVLRKLDAMLGGEDYCWDQKECRSRNYGRATAAAAGGIRSSTSEAATATTTERPENMVDASFKAWFLVELLLLCLVPPPSTNAPQVESMAADCIRAWLTERKQRMLNMHDPALPV